MTAVAGKLWDVLAQAYGPTVSDIGGKVRQIAQRHPAAAHIAGIGAAVVGGGAVLAAAAAAPMLALVATAASVGVGGTVLAGRIDWSASSAPSEEKLNDICTFVQGVLENAEISTEDKAETLRCAATDPVHKHEQCQKLFTDALKTLEPQLQFIEEQSNLSADAQRTSVNQILETLSKNEIMPNDKKAEFLIALISEYPAASEILQTRATELLTQELHRRVAAQVQANLPPAVKP